MAETSSSASGSKPLTGRVAQIINARELVITIGAAVGVRKGMKFAILAEQPLQILHPDTKEVLDVIDREKVRVEVSEIREKITICRTFVTRLVGGDYSMYIADVFGSRKPPREVVETLRASDSSLPPPLSESESYVKINDRVVQVVE